MQWECTVVEKVSKKSQFFGIFSSKANSHDFPFIARLARKIEIFCNIVVQCAWPSNANCDLCGVPLFSKEMWRKSQVLKKHFACLVAFFTTTAVVYFFATFALHGKLHVRQFCATLPQQDIKRGNIFLVYFWQYLFDFFSSLTTLLLFQHQTNKFLKIDWSTSVLVSIIHHLFNFFLIRILTYGD